MAMITKTVLIGSLSVVLAMGGRYALHAGELTVDGSLTVRTNLTVQGRLSSATLSLTNMAISGQATIQKADIKELVPQGDLSMGPYTNRVAQ